MTLAKLISIIAAHSIRGSKIPDDLARWRRELAQEILAEIEMDRAGQNKFSSP